MNTTASSSAFTNQAHKDLPPKTETSSYHRHCPAPGYEYLRLVHKKGDLPFFPAETTGAIRLPNSSCRYSVRATSHARPNPVTFYNLAFSAGSPSKLSVTPFSSNATFQSIADAMRLFSTLSILTCMVVLFPVSPTPPADSPRISNRRTSCNQAGNSMARADGPVTIMEGVILGLLLQDASDSETAPRQYILIKGICVNCN